MIFAALGVSLSECRVKSCRWANRLCHFWQLIRGFRFCVGVKIRPFPLAWGVAVNTAAVPCDKNYTVVVVDDDDDDKVRCCVSGVQTFIVVARDKMIFRFSATKGFNLLSPFNPARRAAIYVYSHPYPLTVHALSNELKSCLHVHKGLIIQLTFSELLIAILFTK